MHPTCLKVGRLPWIQKEKLWDINSPPVHARRRYVGRMLAFPENGRGLGVLLSQSAVKRGSIKPDGMFARVPILLPATRLETVWHGRQAVSEPANWSKVFRSKGNDAFQGKQ